MRFIKTNGLARWRAICGTVLLCGWVAAGTPSSWDVVIAADGEPGQRMTISGTVLLADGKTPVDSVAVYIYHTDNRGYYSPEGRDEGKPRLHATLTTGARGQYRFTTIKPAPYPNSSIPAHVHFVITLRDGQELQTELLFEGDPSISDRMRARAARHDFFSITTLKAKDGILVGTYDIILPIDHLSAD